MKNQFIAPIPFFRLDDINVYDYLSLKLSNPTGGIFANDIVDVQFMNAFGVHGMSKFNTEWAFVCKTFDDGIDTAHGEEATNKFNEYLVEVRSELHAFDTFLWFIKDNSCGIQHIFGKAISDRAVGYVSFDFKEIISDSLGQVSNVSFSIAELEQCLEIRKKLFSICPTYLENEVTSNLEAEGENNQIERAFKFLRSARSVLYLPAKLAMYMSVFECLFSTEPGELTQKISERVAFYIGRNKEERVSMFEDIRNAYQIRSRYLHGGTASNKFKKRSFQVELTPKIDDIARKVLTQVIMHDSNIFLKDKNELEVYLKELIFQ